MIQTSKNFLELFFELSIFSSLKHCISFSLEMWIAVQVFNASQNHSSYEQRNNASRAKEISKYLIFAICFSKSSSIIFVVHSVFRSQFAVQSKPSRTFFYKLELLRKTWRWKKKNDARRAARSWKKRTKLKLRSKSFQKFFTVDLLTKSLRTEAHLLIPMINDISWKSD